MRHCNNKRAAEASSTDASWADAFWVD